MIFTTPDYPDCPFSGSAPGPAPRSLYCPESVCPAVYIASEGAAADTQVLCTVLYCDVLY